MPPDRRCDACGQKIPPTAKLASTGVTPAHARLLGISGLSGPETGQVSLTLCLNCRIHLSKLTR